MSKVVKSESSEIVIIQVESLSVLENINSKFDVHSRADSYDEVILDCTILDGNEQAFKSLCDALEIDLNDEMAEKLKNVGYVVFYA